MQPSLLKKIIFSLVTVLAFFFLLEMGARFVVLIESWHHGEGSRVRKQQSKSTGSEFVVFVYGESTVFGKPLPEVGFVKQFEFYFGKLLPQKKIRVVNFGVPGMSSTGVLETLKRTISQKPDLAVILVGHNDLLDPRARPPRLPLVFQQKSVFVRELSRFWTSLYIKYFSTRQEKLLRDYNRIIQKTSRRKIHVYFSNLSEMVAVTARERVPLLLGTLPYNRFWPPTYYEKAETAKDFKELILRAHGLLEQGKVPQAREILEGLLEKDGTIPLVLYLLGRCCDVLGDYKKAEAYLSAAKEFDEYRIRVPDAFNEFIRQIADQRGVYLVDVEREFQRQSPHGLIGYELVADNCHPTPLGSFYIVSAILRALGENSLVQGKVLPDPVSLLPEPFLKEAGFSKKNSGLAKAYAMRNASYHLRRYNPAGDYLPYKYRKAREFLDEALRIDPDDWVVWAELAAVSFFSGDIPRGKKELQRAKSLSGGMIDFDNERVPGLRAAADLAGVKV
ncbi:MAG: tetratricopeptide repeat protein [Candidatus Omnitrophota bacterium]